MYLKATIEEGYYVSPCGQVWSVIKGKGRFLKQNEVGTKREYRAVTLNGKPYLVHRLVATAYLDNPDNLPQVNHKDKNGAHNNDYNLEWCSALYNIQYSHAIKGSLIDPKGKLHNFPCIKQFCREQGLDSGAVSRVLRGEYKQTKGWVINE